MEGVGISRILGICHPGLYVVWVCNFLHQSCFIFFICCLILFRGVSRVARVVKTPSPNAGDIRDSGLIPGLGRSPGEGHVNPLQYSCLDNPMDRRAWQATLHSVVNSRTQLKWLSTRAAWLGASTALGTLGVPESSQQPYMKVRSHFLISGGTH